MHVKGKEEKFLKDGKKYIFHKEKQKEWIKKIRNSE